MEKSLRSKIFDAFIFFLASSVFIFIAIMYKRLPNEIYYVVGATSLHKSSIWISPAIIYLFFVTLMLLAQLPYFYNLPDDIMSEESLRVYKLYFRFMKLIQFLLTAMLWLITGCLMGAASSTFNWCMMILSFALVVSLAIMTTLLNARMLVQHQEKKDS